MTAKEYTDWWGEAEVVSLNRTQYMGIVADFAAAEEREEWWKNVAATADKHRMDMMAERDELKESLHESNMQCARLDDMVAGLTRTVDDTVQELAEAERQIDALAAEKREIEAALLAERPLGAGYAEAEVRERERAAFVAGVGWADDHPPESGASDQSGETEAVSRYPEKE